MKKYKICVIKGDGIGPEVTEAAVKVLEALPVKFEFVPAEAGYGAFKKTGKSVPDDALATVKSCDTCLKGPITTPEDVPGYRSANVTLRGLLDLYANVRPCKSYPNANAMRDDIDLVIVRENTEGLYAGIEGKFKEDVTFATRIITRKGCERVIKFAFELAQKRRKHLTCVHKANILRITCGMFKDIFFESAKKYAGVAADEVHVDAMAMRLIKQPQDYDVVVTTNLFGDIISDEAAQLVGGLGMAPGANIGDKYSFFEPIHGSAPKYAGQNKVNPIATILAASLMLVHLGELESAKKIEDAVTAVLRERKTLTYDLGGTAKTGEVADAVIAKLNAKN